MSISGVITATAGFNGARDTANIIHLSFIRAKSSCFGLEKGESYVCVVPTASQKNIASLNSCHFSVFSIYCMLLDLSIYLSICHAAVVAVIVIAY